MERKSFAESAMVNDPASKIFKANNQVAGSSSYACKFVMLEDSLHQIH
jgi:hypothetical protein